MAAKKATKASAKKSTAKKKPAAKKKTTAKKAVAPAPAKAVKEKLTKSALVGLLAEQNDLTRVQVNGVLSSLEDLMMGSLRPRGIGEFTLPGMLKITLRKVPARKAGTLVRNPATGEMMKAAAKPASVRVKVRPLSKLKNSALK